MKLWEVSYCLVDIDELGLQYFDRETYLVIANTRDSAKKIADAKFNETELFKSAGDEELSDCLVVELCDVGRQEPLSLYFERKILDPEF